MSTLITKEWGNESAMAFAQSIEAGVPYYVFTSKNTPYSVLSDQNEVPVDSHYEAVTSIYDGMIFGKKAQPDDVIPVALRHDWSANTVYDMYDNLSVDLEDKPYYASVNVGSFTNIYKCLYNNKGKPSTVEPSGQDTIAFESPVDGYIWKYMCSVDDSEMRKFASKDFIPIKEDINVRDAAIHGSIDVIVVEDPGAGYDNYLLGQFNLASDIRVGGSQFIYGLNEDAVPINDFYKDCIIKITSGECRSQVSLVTDYVISGAQRLITVETPFEGQIRPNDTYEIYPNVIVYDKGAQMQANCIARAIVDPISNTIAKVDVMNGGIGYRAASAEVQAGSSVPVSRQAQVRVIIPPHGGHGANTYSELNANKACVSVQFIEDEEPFTVANDYRTIGLLKEPLFANVSFMIDEANTVGEFVTNETLYSYYPIVMTGECAVTSGSQVITGTDTFFEVSINVNDRVLISDGNLNLFGNVISVASNTSLTLDTPANFTLPATKMILCKDITPVGRVNSTFLGEIVCNDVRSENIKSIHLIGGTGFATSQLNQNLTDDQQVLINGTRFADNFSKFNQLTSFYGNLLTGTFEEDEEVWQYRENAAESPTANFHSIVEGNNTPNDTMYVTNPNFLFLANSSHSTGIINGRSSEATFEITAKYDGDLVKDSGKILYIENLNPISRENNKSETFKIFVEIG